MASFGGTDKQDGLNDLRCWLGRVFFLVILIRIIYAAMCIV